MLGSGGHSPAGCPLAPGCCTEVVHAAGDNVTAIPTALTMEPPSTMPEEPSGSPLPTFPLPPPGGMRALLTVCCVPTPPPSPGDRGPPPPCRGKEPAPCLQTHSLCPQTPATAPWASPPCPIAASPPQPSSSSTQPVLLICTTSPRGWSCRAGPPQLTPSLVCLPTYPSWSWTCCRPPTSPVGAACHVALALPPQWALRRCWCQSMQLHANKFHISPNRGGGAGGRGWGCLHHCLPAAVQH